MVSTRRKNAQKFTVDTNNLNLLEIEDEVANDDEYLENDCNIKLNYKTLKTFKSSENWEKKWNNSIHSNGTPKILLESLKNITLSPINSDMYEYICDESCKNKCFDIQLNQLVKNKKKNVKTFPEINLSLYNSYNLKYKTLHKIYANVGGPICSIAWCPKLDFPQYIAVSTHRHVGQLTFIGEKLSEKGTIQIWSFDKNKDLKLVMLFMHDYDPVFDIKWIPVSNDEISSLGCIAFSGCDEVVRIACIPSPKIHTKSKFSEQRGFTLNVVAELLPCPKNSTVDNTVLRHELVGNVTSISVSPFAPFEKIIAGYSNGYICLWNLKNENLIESMSSKDCMPYRIFPQLMKCMFDSSVSGVEFCPHLKDIVIVNGLVRKIFVLDITRPDQSVIHIDRYIAKCLKWAKYCTEPYIIDLLYPANFKNGLHSIKVISTYDQADEDLPSTNFDFDKDRIFSLAGNFTDMSICNYSGFIVAVTSNGDCLVCNKNSDYGSKATRFIESCVYTVSQKSKFTTYLPDTSSSFKLMNVCEIPLEKVSQLKKCTTEEWRKSILPYYNALTNNGFVYNEFQCFYKSYKRNNIVNQLINSNNIQDDPLLNPCSINKVALNENICCLGWLASGGNHGLLKVEDLSGYFDDIKSLS